MPSAPAKVRSLLLLFLAVAVGAPALQAVPPFWGTIFVNKDILTSADPTAFTTLADAGRGNRWMYDRRVANWVYLNPYLFTASFSDGLAIEIQVNPEFASVEAARVEAAKYAPVIGQLPKALRKDVRTVWIHQGVQPFGGGNNNLLIHTGQTALYEADGILEETLIHEAAHTSLDAAHAAAPGWVAAQTADGEFISQYAKDYPTREDIAESFLLYLALRHRSDRIPASLATTIQATIPNRIAYFDSLNLDLSPMVATEPPPPPRITAVAYDRASQTVNLTWTSRPGATYRVEISADMVVWGWLVASVNSQGETTQFSALVPGDNRFFIVRELP